MMNKIILKIGKFKRIISDQEFEFIDINTDELLQATYSLNSNNCPDFVIGEKYDIIVSPYDLYRGRIITSRKNYDLDYSHIE